MTAPEIVQQLRRYAWPAKLPLGILADFEEFATYDCRTKPDKNRQGIDGERMLALYKQDPKTPQEQGETESTDISIDRLVYELYGLSEEEIKIVEGV